MQGVYLDLPDFDVQVPLSVFIDESAADYTNARVRANKGGVLIKLEYYDLKAMKKPERDSW